MGSRIWYPSIHDPATGYIARNGAYVVRNDRTGVIVEMSDRSSINGIAFWRNGKDGIATWEAVGAKTGAKDISGSFKTTNHEVTRSAHKLSVDDLLKPGGDLLGTVKQGTTPNIRTVSSQDFAKLHEQILNGAKKAESYANGKGIWYELPNGGRVGVRTSAKSGVTLDIDIPGYPKGFKVHQQ